MTVHFQPYKLKRAGFGPNGEILAEYQIGASNIILIAKGNMEFETIPHVVAPEVMMHAIASFIYHGSEGLILRLQEAEQKIATLLAKSAKPN